MTAPFIFAAAFVCVGALMIAYPRAIRAVDTRMTRLIKDEGQYVVACRVMGALMLLLALAALAISTVPQDQISK
jgi:hypothetical protein